MFENEMNTLLHLANCENMLVEMADIMSSDQQHGYLVTVFSNDHEPPHAHLRKLNGETFAMILITDEAPKNINELQLYKTDRLSSKIKKDLVKWANDIDPDFGCTYWTTLKNFWKRFQSSNMKKG